MKRTLALVLALVMVLGMMAVPASAAFTDAKEIKYVEAVDVVAACGIIDGFEDGSFDPDGTLTREQAAKVVAYMLLGPKNADALKATSAPFEDVAANRWSAGYIAYVANEGIINGRDEKTFDPTATVTGLEFAKLMLGALGYSSKIEQYVGAAWSVNVGKTALDIDLFDGNDGADYNAPCTREEAALYIFNTLQADLVEYETKGTEIDLGNGIIISTGASKAEPVTTKNANGAKIVDEKTDDQTVDVYTYQFAEKYFTDLEKDANTDKDAFGRPAVKWVYDDEKVGTYADEADETYTVATKGKTVYADLGKPENAKFTYYVDGKSAEKTDIAKDFDIANGVDAKIGGNGTLVEVFKTAKGQYTVVVVNTYVAEISGWTKANEDKNVKESVNIALIDDADIELKSNKFETKAFSEDDVDDETVVLFTAAYDNAEKNPGYVVKSVVAADSATATPTGYKAGTSLTAGSTYKYSANYAIDEAAVKTAIDGEDELVIYTDTYGHVIYTDGVEATTNYAFVIKAADTSGKLDTDAKYEAKLLLASGEVVVAELDDAGETDVTNMIVKYTVDKDGVYKLTAPSEAAADATSLAITAKKAVMTVDGKNSVVANSKTVFFVESEEDGKAVYDVYTGIANVPTLKGNKDTDAAVVLDSTTVKAIYVKAATEDSSSDSDEVIYVVGDNDAEEQYDVDLGTYYEHTVITGGEIKTMKFANKVAADKLLKKVTLDKNGVVETDVDKATNLVEHQFAAEGTNKAKDGNLTFNDVDLKKEGKQAGTYTYDESLVVYVVDGDEVTKGSLSSIKDDANDTVIFVMDKDETTIKTVYLTVNANA